MNKEVQSIIKNLENTLSGQPWFGRAVYELLDEIDETKVSIKPNDKEHSLLELLWHMNTWADFVLAHLENKTPEEVSSIEANDWRVIDPQKHTWEKGIAELKAIHKEIISLLNEKDDSFLKEMVPGRQFNFRFMLNGLIQHNIYHAGQIAYLKKMLD
ncbi:MAG: DinB family protein [Sphingobacteriales bacterium]|nr:DinB family protein [Sphingobacteriales bacterium]